MSDLNEFLLARFDEDEAAASRSMADANSGKTLGVPSSWLTGVAERVLAEVAAKRAIAELHRSLRPEHALCIVCDETEGLWPCETIRHLAAVYADHPDYREEWRP